MDAAKARDKRMTQDYIAEQIGVTKQAVNGWRRTGKIDKANLAKLAQVTGSDLAELLDVVPATTVNDDEYTDVLGYSQAAALGDGEEPMDYAETHSLKFKRTSLDGRGLNAANCAVFYGKGDSMLPTIKDGAAILFDTSKTRPVDGGLFVILVPGINGSNYSVKRCIELDGSWWFDALNPDGEHAWRRPKPMESKRHPIQIIGKVEWVASWVD
ncbi:LexA family transcriptional regulator [Aquilutibacter rugosus]